MVAHFPLDQLAARLRSRGLIVHVRSGAQGKSARKFAVTGYSRLGCRAVVMHHTGSSGLSPSGDIGWLDGKGGTDPGFVIANGYVARSGELTLIASGPTYTEGAGGPRGTIPADTGNDVSFSWEIGGTTTSTYPAAQQNAALIAAHESATLAAELWGWPDSPHHPHRMFAHHEWAAGRKVDPGGVSRWSPTGGLWDMNAFRADASTLAEPPPAPPPPPPPPIPTPEDDMRFARVNGDQAVYFLAGMTARWIRSGDELAALAAQFGISPNVDVLADKTPLKAYTLLGDHPQYEDRPVVYTSSADFHGSP